MYGAEPVGRPAAVASDWIVPRVQSTVTDFFGQEPFKGMHPMQVPRAVVDKKERPLVPAGIVGAQGYVELMVACWDHEPVRRPSFSEILTRLSGIPR